VLRWKRIFQDILRTSDRVLLPSPTLCRTFATLNVDVSDGPKAFKRELKTVGHEDFILDVRSYEREHPTADLNTLFAEAIRLFNKHKGTWIVTMKTQPMWETLRRSPISQKNAKGPATQKAPGELKTHDAAGNPIDRRPTRTR
jgi:hypothetical protein